LVVFQAKSGFFLLFSPFFEKKTGFSSNLVGFFRRFGYFFEFRLDFLHISENKTDPWSVTLLAILF